MMMVDMDEGRILDLADAALKEWGRSAASENLNQTLGFSRAKKAVRPAMPESAEEIADRVESAMRRLTPVEREILVMLYVKRKAAREVQDALKMSPGTYQRKLYAMRRVVYSNL
jgi:RNA polymerase sigma factor (sigma-70 family)